MGSAPWLIPHVLDMLPKDLSKLSVLDCACGFGRWGALLRTDYRGGHEAYVVGCDLFLDYLKRARVRSLYDDLILCDLRKPPFRRKSFSLTLAGEVIEHLEKEEGVSFIKELEEVTSGQLVITAPNGSFDPELESENVYNTHKSAWSAADFKRLGFRVKGIRLRFKPSSRFHLSIRQPLWIVYKMLSPISDIFPSLAEFLIAIKDVNN